MARPAIFPVPTKLWHPAEGWREFPQGEQDPGPAWHDKEGGEAPGAKSTVSVMKDLIEAQDQIEAKDQLLASKQHDLDQAEKRASDAVAALEAQTQALADAERAKADAEQVAAELTAERDQARQEAAGLQSKVGPLEETVERLTAELAEANQRAADLADKLSKFDGDGDGKPGGSKAKDKAEKPAA